ncbi:metallophosphoesterase [Streptomyces sanyensis]|uniref:metallophosphoesterase family protein n=1 Tax=Streptomyces sanyensis TaxID=568869 RepID=UPI003D7822E4
MRRTIIIGDIHGCNGELLELLDEVDIQPDDLLVSVGDLVDRGPEPGAVVTLFRERPNSVVVMGNHERKHVRGIFSYAQEITRLQLGDHYAETVNWMRTLPYYFENEHVRVVHAAMLPGIPLSDQREDILCGSTRGERELTKLFPDCYWHEHYTDAKPVVLGHHVTGRKPMIRDGRIFGLDTGACHGGTLTALCLPGFTVHSVKAQADHWSTTKHEWQLPVLKNRPWHDFTWLKLAQAVERFSSPSDPVAHRWLEALQEWATGLQSTFPALVATAHRVADELTPDEMCQHPAAKVLFQARNGRLDQASLAKQCPTPGRTIELAAALGLILDDLPKTETVS